MEQHQIACPQCQRSAGQSKVGHTAAGSQRYLCKLCRHKYTPEPQPIGYPQQMREQALRMSVEGLNLRRIGRLLGVTHQTVANWVAAHAASLPETPPLPSTPVAVGELDELYTFVGRKKTASTSSPS